MRIRGSPSGPLRLIRRDCSLTMAVKAGRLANQAGDAELTTSGERSARRKRIMRKLIASAMLAMCTAAVLASSPAKAQNKLRFGLIAGPPPIFAAIIGHVAQEQGFFKKHGVEV